MPPVAERDSAAMAAGAQRPRAFVDTRTRHGLEPIGPVQYCVKSNRPGRSLQFGP